MFDLLMWHLWKMLAIVASIIATISGCSGGPLLTESIAGTPVAQQHADVASPPRYSSEENKPNQDSRASSGAQHDAPTKPAKPDTPQDVELAPGVVVAGKDAALIATHRVARMVDPCALHDPAAASRVTGEGPDALMPSRRGLNICELTLAPAPGDLPTWRLTATVGADFDAHQREQSVQEQIGELNFFRDKEPAAGKPTDSGSCHYTMSFGETTGIELAVRATGLAPATKTACDVAKEYLAAVAATWKEPAMRGDKVTAPALKLADVDPCSGVSAVARDFPAPVRAKPDTPYECALTAADYRKGGSLLSIELTMETDPRALLVGPLANKYAAITVAGRPGVSTQMQTKGVGGQIESTCYVTVLADEKTAIQEDEAMPDSQKSMQVIKALAKDCAVAIRAAEGVLATLTR